MSLKKVLMLSFAALVAGGSLSAQNLIVGADFATRFDNREYANNDFNESQTLFSARLTPRIGVEWMGKTAWWSVSTCCRTSATTPGS